jgi:peptide/nickel transport system permease protein
MRFLLRRLIEGVLLLFAASVLSFLLAEAAPGDFLSEMRMNPDIPAETVETLRREYGLDRPLAARYVRWAQSALRGELGMSFAYNMPVSAILWRPLANTVTLALLGLLVAWLAGLPLGVWCAARPRGWLASLADLTATGIISVPDILIGLACLFLTLQTGLLSAAGSLPAAVLAIALVSFPPVFRHTRGSVRQVISSGFIESARAHGLPESRILFRYALPTAANPLVSLFGLSIASVMSSSLVVEVVMGWPGLGPLLLEAIFARDIHVIVAAVLLSAVLLLAANFVSDLLLYLFDPRIRAGES